MSDFTESASHAASSSIVDAVHRRLAELAGPAEAARVVPFADLFFAKAPPDFLQERSTETLAHLVLGTFHFLQQARPGRVDAQVFNPTLDDEGWAAPVTVVRTNIADRPFIVDTIREFLHAQGLEIEYLIYPTARVERDGEGRIVTVAAPTPGEPAESLVYCEVAQITDADEREAIRGEIARRLEDVVRATGDFDAMRGAVDRVVGELSVPAEAVHDRQAELTEIQAFLRWLRDGGFVFLGYRAYDLTGAAGRREVRVEPGSGLGILRDESRSRYAEGVALESLDPALRARVAAGPTLIISKTNAESTIHRRARMDYVGVKKLDAAGEVVGEHRFVGLFTSRAYAEDAERIPILRAKLARLLKATGVGADSHDYKEMHTIFNSMPKEDLFLASAEEIESDIRAVLGAYHADTVRVTLRGDVLRRGVPVMVIIPGDRYSHDVRRSIESILIDVFGGEVLNFHLALGDGGQARLHFYMAAHPDRRVAAEDLEARIGEITRSWSDRVREGLDRVRPPDEARRLARRYGIAFSPEYQAATASAVAVQDILELEAMQAEGRPVSVTFDNHADLSWVPGDEKVTELRLYQSGGPLVLSDFMPILENAGLRVVAVNPFEVKGGGVAKAIVYAFAVQDKAGAQVDVEGRGAAVAQTLLAVRAGDVSNDITNGLVLATGLHWREVDVLRAYSAYAFQLGAVTARFALPNAMLKHPQVAKMLFDLFAVKFDPDRPESTEARASAARDVKTAVVQALQSVTSLAEDRALRRLLGLIEATIRTNYYRVGGRTPTQRSGGVPYVSLKFDCDALAPVVKSRLTFEVWVRSSRMEGIHLRGAKVARGGIRWSDRLDDFRTEILGLVKTQVVKNAVIVPSGSKGGFVLLRPPHEPEKVAEEGKEQYRTLMRGLLDLTDNLDADGRIVPPGRVIAFDEPDPYLVVAADKGTAKFSDVANGVAAEYGFWLGDAFASGGSQGYDHKAVGITAMGAWECVKRHFQERGKDVQTEPFTVVGIGDMSGDVFGNGMLLSRAIRLVAAFDHRHVFLDPDPDPETSFVERQRLFLLPRSSWADYDRGALSKGGMVVPRGAKEVALGPEVLAALGLPPETGAMDGEALVRAVLRAPAELLWNGGIGTYVKASEESHQDAGDPPNDAVRVDADQLRCEVVGEGGNLGFTQRARIEYALAGGRIDTDALDNSAGVDLSDHEVNLKILLNPSVRSGRIPVERRNALLEALTREVAELVLKDNRSQSLAVSLDEMRVRDGADEFRDLMIGLEKSGMLDRLAETLPTAETLAERREAGRSFTRPELCVLLAYAKLWVKSRLLDGALPDDPLLETYLEGYFPRAAVDEVGRDRLHAHRLRREIVTSQVTNDVVDLMGAPFVMRMSRDSGCPADEVVRAWAIAAHLAGHRALLRRVDGEPGPLPTEVRYGLQLRVSRTLERAARWVLRNVASDVPAAWVFEQSLDGLAALRGRFGEIVAGGDRALYEERRAEMGRIVTDERLIDDMASLRFLDQMLEILRIARETAGDPIEVARAYYRVSEALDLQWLRTSVLESAGDDRWEQRAALALADDLGRAHHRMVEQVMRARAGAPGVEAATARAIEAHRVEVARFRALLQEIQAETAVTLPGLSVAVREIAWLAERMSRPAV